MLQGSVEIFLDKRVAIQTNGCLSIQKSKSLQVNLRLFFRVGIYEGDSMFYDIPFYWLFNRDPYNGL